jgi:GxxExxY protein
MDSFEEGKLEQLTEKVIGCGIAVHREFGPGLLESVYQACMMIELAEAPRPS